MKSFLIAATIALVGTGMMSGDASARNARMNQAGMGAMMAMAPAMIETGAALISSGALSGPIATPHELVGAPSIAPIVVPHHVHVPVALPVVLPGVPSIVTLPTGSID
jgi:hypothetical protein